MIRRNGSRPKQGLRAGSTSRTTRGLGLYSPNSITKDELIAILDTVEKELKNIVNDIKSLEEMLKSNNPDDDTLVKSYIVIKNAGYTKDIEIFEDILALIKKVEKIIPQLKKAINDYVPEIPYSLYSDPNVYLAVYMTSFLVYLTSELPIALAYIIRSKYLKLRVDPDYALPSNLTISLVSMFLTFVKNLKKYVAVDYEKIVDIIGKIPNLNLRRPRRDLSLRLTSNMGDELLAGLLGSKSGLTFNFVKKLLGFTNKGRKITKADLEKSQVIVEGFIGNPFYHIGKFLVDLQKEKLDRLKNTKKYLELTLNDLRVKRERGELDPKYDKLIEQYEKRIKKLEERINYIMN